MHSWKKKLVVSQLALACTLAITSQANATTYDTWTYIDNPTTALDWTNMDLPGTVDGNYVNYSGFVYYNNANGDFDQTFNGDTVNGTISTYYLNHDYTDGVTNTLNISNSVIHGSITSMLPMGTSSDGSYVYQYSEYGTDRVIDENWHDGDVFNLNISNTTIDDDYEGLYFTDSYLNGDITKYTNETFNTAAGEGNEFAGLFENGGVGLGLAVNLDVESNITIANNSHVAGISLTQGNTVNDTYTTESHTWDNSINVYDSTVTSGSVDSLEETGFYGNSAEPSDYTGNGGDNDVALYFSDSASSHYSMKNNVYFSNSTLLGDVVFESTFNEGFYPQGYDSNGDDVYDTNGGWADDTLNVDELNITLDNGSKWIGSATTSANVDDESMVSTNWYDVTGNSLYPGVVVENNNWGRTIDDQVFQSGVFNVTLNNGSEWDTVNQSNIDTLAVNNGSQVNVAESSLISDTITLTNGSSMNIGDEGYVGTDHLTIDSYSTVDLSSADNTSIYSVAGYYYTPSLYANTITVTNGGMLDVNVDQFDNNGVFSTDKLELTSGNTADHNGNVVSGVFNIHSSDYVLNADLVNDRTWDTTQANYGYGTIAMNSDGHLTINGNGDINNGDELDNSSVDNVVAATGNYKVRIDNATGAGSVADYKGNELIYVNDVNTDATFSAANKADLGAYTYQAKQEGNTVVLEQMELTDYANMALSIPSANTNIWNLEQDTVGTRLTNARHGLADNGGAWVSYFGGNFNGDNGTINYDQDVNGIMVGVDTKVDGNNAKWIVGAAAGFAKGDLSDRTGQVDQDSQSAYIYSSARFANNIFVDGNLSYSHFNNDLSANMSDGTYVDGNTSSDAWGFGLKLGYDLKLGDAGYVTPYGSVSGLFQSGDDYQLSNDMKVDGQSYDSMRYELGVDAGYTFTYSEDQALTPYFKLAYVYDDSNNDADVNGDSIDNGVEGSAVRVGLGTQFSFTKNFSAYTDANYLGGGDVDQDWSANVGVKYTW
ncbi:TPA: autotransporter outer membrane beta-barrel domain-containing protein [Salmonella enterica]|uniref:Autotransporter outer membrane beta-barrel domain-containing protein n=1 Tax=Salmonella enterica subsp. enterica serovar Corvallis TaxID=593905 RepID=A0A8E7QJX8_SALET|nr:autotransporter outer membrane beta-barrel domain-containing protein [Salmonella enterica]EJN2878003.1 autotransporter outer membrane beta-barrel domain-containing protein [Salmonella enterica subsp. enterica serovar Goelzau]EBF0721606.1 autotransporter outer membrane beta-barrel domain-containing protein [Salmonella enterica]EBQ6137649.1 autotransporter outer membrane beta-barrel domain-containing protein [Salmonella enterica subsp. enterica serovar Corvallis]EEA5364566.1 autotransporter ou